MLFQQPAMSQKKGGAYAPPFAQNMGALFQMARQAELASRVRDRQEQREVGIIVH